MIINFPEKSGIVEITLYNIDGKVIITRTFNFQNSIINLSLSDVSMGVYFIKSEIDNKVFRNKLIVVK